MIAHEYFHNWTGDRITCRDWFQLCLKEGLTVFRDQEFTADQRSRAVKRIGDVRALRAHQFVEDAGPLAHPVRPEVYREINNFYTSTVYEKGAEVVRMIRTLLGAETFRAGMDLYFARHDGEAATVEEFVAVLRRRQPTRPHPIHALVPPGRHAGNRGHAALRCRAPRPTGSTSPRRCRRRRGSRHKEPMVIPLADRPRRQDGGDLPLMLDGAPLARGVIELTQPSQSFVFTGLDERPMPSLNRGFSAPIKLTLPIARRRSRVPRRA